MIEDELNIYRLVWHSWDFDANNDLKPTAFDSRDLRPDMGDDGLPRYSSVDLTQIISQPSVDWRVAQWQAGDARIRLKREEIKFAEYNCGMLRGVVDSLGQTPLCVTPEPETAKPDGEPANPAHCGLRNRLGVRGSKKEIEGYINKLRTGILKTTIRIRSYGDVFSASS